MTDLEKNLEEKIKLFLNYKTVSGGMNRVYIQTLRRFENFCYENYADQKELTQEMIDSWCQKRSSELNGSRNTRIKVVRAFIKFLNQRGLSCIELPVLLKSEKCKYIPHSFTEEELKAFFFECDHICKDGRRFSNYKNLVVPVLFRLLYSSGIRTTEARLLKREDVDFENGILKIRKGKGSDKHYVALHSSTVDMLKKYDFAMDKLKKNRTYFFEKSNGSFFDTSWLSRCFRECWYRANKTSAVPYDLRHNYATTNINSWETDSFEFNDKLFFLSKSMGHKKLVSTLYYYSIVPRLSETIKDKTESDLNEIIKEVNYEE
jgi:integrase